MSDHPTIINEVISSVNANDRKLTNDKLGELYEQLKTDRELINWIITPTNLTLLQDVIIEKYDIPRKVMRVRHRIPSRTRRALMFAHALRMSVARTIKDE